MKTLASLGFLGMGAGAAMFIVSFLADEKWLAVVGLPVGFVGALAWLVGKIGSKSA